MLLTTCDGAIFIVASPAALCSHEQECCLVLPTGGGPLPDWLQEAPINIIPLSECETRLGGSWIYFNSQYQQCAFDNTGTNPDGPAGPCYGLCDVILRFLRDNRTELLQLPKRYEQNWKHVYKAIRGATQASSCSLPAITPYVPVSGTGGLGQNVPDLADIAGCLESTK